MIDLIIVLVLYFYLKSYGSNEMKDKLVDIENEIKKKFNLNKKEEKKDYVKFDIGKYKINKEVISFDIEKEHYNGILEDEKYLRDFIKVYLLDGELIGIVEREILNENGYSYTQVMKNIKKEYMELSMLQRSLVLFAYSDEKIMENRLKVDDKKRLDKFFVELKLK